MTDLAQETGLSKMTISRVFSGSANVREKTRDKVLKAADKIGYEYNALAAGFASGKSRMIGVAVDVDNLLGTTYFSRTFKGIITTLQESGYRALLLDTSSDEFSSGEKIQRLIKQRRVEGLLAVAPPTKDQSFVTSFTEASTSTVLIGNKSKLKDIPAITFDNAHAIELLVEHLADLGHQKVAFIKGSDRIIDSLEREKAFIQMRDKKGLSQNSSFIVQGDYSYGGGREAAKQLLSLKNRPTAIVACNDRAAIGAYESIRAAGLTPGKEVSVVGIDDALMGSQAKPGLTTIAQPNTKMGSLGAKNILQLVNDLKLSTEDHTTKLQGELIIRESTARPV